MMKLALSPAAAGLLRAICARTGVERHRILLGDFQSTDWQSLTFSGERHEIRVRITGNDADMLCTRLTDGLEDAEFSIPGHVVADITVKDAPVRQLDGSMDVTIEALTVSE